MKHPFFTQLVKCLTYILRNLFRIQVIYQVFKTHLKHFLLKFRCSGIYIIIDGDQPGIQKREYLGNVIFCVNIVSAQAGKVFHNNAVYMAFHDLFHHVFKTFP